MTDPGFPVNPGDTVRWWTKTGFAHGSFVRFNRRGNPVVVPAGKSRERSVDRIYPVNDERMKRLRGHATLSGYNDSSPKRTRRR